MINLSPIAFFDEVKKGRIPPLFGETTYADPFAVYQSIGERKYTVFLDSPKGTSKIARYSFIATDPYLIFRLKNGEVEVEDRTCGRRTASYRAPLERMHELIAVYPQQLDPELPPFSGGAIGLFSYDFARYIEKLPEHAVDDLNIPDANFLFLDTVFAFDHSARRAWIICAPGARSTGLGYRDIQRHRLARCL